MNIEHRYAEIWTDDRLGYAEIGGAFTNIVKSINDSKVISIEAPFGHGKTFFRTRWVKQLQASGELVIEIDAQQSDHSGDPLITFMGALLKAKPVSGEPLSARIVNGGIKLAGALGKASLRFLLRQGAEEVLDLAADWAKDKKPDDEFLEKTIDDMKSGLSNAAAHMIVTHLAAEEARVQELPAQIDEIRDALLNGSNNKRIVIVIDELDRCHPEYAIALLESMKLVFGRDGFVFILMANPYYLETVASHRFGIGKNDELYLEKFIDMRLLLRAPFDSILNSTQDMIRSVPLNIPYGNSEFFGPDAAAELIPDILAVRSLSYRQIKRIIDRIELVARCYFEKPIDLPLLVLLAFDDAISSNGKSPLIASDILKRAEFTPEKAREIYNDRVSPSGRGNLERNRVIEIRSIENYEPLASLPDDRYRGPEDGKYSQFQRLILGLGPHYIPEHKAMLAGVMRLQSPL